MTRDDAVLLALALYVHHLGGTATRTSSRWAVGFGNASRTSASTRRAVI